MFTFKKITVIIEVVEVVDRTAYSYKRKVKWLVTLQLKYNSPVYCTFVKVVTYSLILYLSLIRCSLTYRYACTALLN